ncbi:MAG: biotin/lipoyl-binding protein, partial [Thermodesulfobacteriota bacterium]
MEPDRKEIDVSSLRINREKPVNRRNLLRLFIIIFLILFVITLTIVWSPNFIPFFRPVVSTARVAIISNSQASTVLTSSGYVVARNKAEISPKSVGRIAWINLEEGQKVEKGELVAKLENLELQAHRDQIVSNLENAKRELTRQEQLFVK